MNGSMTGQADAALCFFGRFDTRRTNAFVNVQFGPGTGYAQAEPKSGLAGLSNLKCCMIVIIYIHSCAIDVVCASWIFIEEERVLNAMTDQLREIYQSKETDELVELTGKATLIDAAYEILDEILVLRGVNIDSVNTIRRTRVAGAALNVASFLSRGQIQTSRTLSLESDITLPH